MDSQTLLEKLDQLESREAIRELKARYLSCCDNKDPVGVRNCFADGEIDIDFGIVGQFQKADDLVALYTEMACHPHMLEMHHGVNSQLSFLSTDHASATWGLQYQLINTQDQTLTQLSGQYRDEYRRENGEWKISLSHFKVKSTLVLKLDSETVSTLVAAQNAG